MSTDTIEKAFRRYRKTQDPADLGELFDVSSERLFALAVKLVRDANVAEDLLQETFIGLIEGIGRHDGVRRGWPYLAGILQQKALLHFRKKGRPVDEDRVRKTEVNEPTVLAEDAEYSKAFVAALADLPEDYRRTLDFVISEGLKPAEIAAREGTSPGAIRTRLHRGIAILRGSVPKYGALPLALAPFEGRGLTALRKSVLSAAPAAPAVAAGFFGLSFAGVAALGFVAIAALASLMILEPWASENEESLRENAQVASLRDQKEDSVEARRGTIESERDLKNRRLDTASEEVALGTRSVATVVSTNVVTTKGEFELVEGQGFSFHAGRVVSLDESDISLGAGVFSVATPHGSSDLRLKVQKRVGKEHSPAAYLRSIRKVVPSHLSFSSTHHLSKGNPRSCVFVVRTKDGGWAICAVESFQRERSARRIRIHFRFNDEHPLFAPDARYTQGSPTVEVDLSAFRNDKALDRALDIEKRCDERFKEELRRLDDRVLQYQARSEEGLRVAGVLSRTHALTLESELPFWFERNGSPAYVAATFSFRHGIRDDEDLRLTRNDWCLQLSREKSVHVNMVVDDRSRIWRLGKGSGHHTPTANFPSTIPLEKVTVDEQDEFIIHTVDSDWNNWTYVRIVNLRPGHSMIFEWKNFGPSRDFLLADATKIGLMEGPRVLIRLRSGTRGSTTNRILLDGSKGSYLDQLGRLDRLAITEISPQSKEGSTGYSEGSGRIEPGRKWVITAIRWIVNTKSSNARGGEFRVVIKEKVIVRYQQGEVDRRDQWQGRIEMTDRDLDRSYVEIPSSSSCEVIFDGHFE